MSNRPTIAVDYGPGQTTEIGGSRFPFWDSQGIMPTTWGQVDQSASYAVPSVPPNYGQPGYTGSPVSSSEVAALDATSAPFSMTKSPLLWAVIGLIGAYVVIHKVHWSAV